MRALFFYLLNCFLSIAILVIKYNHKIQIEEIIVLSYKNKKLNSSYSPAHLLKNIKICCRYFFIHQYINKTTFASPNLFPSWEDGTDDCSLHENDITFKNLSSYVSFGGD